MEIESAGISLAANVLGETSDFLLLHAGGEKKEVWLPVQRQLARAGLGSCAVDQRGHGESSGTTQEELEWFADDLKHMLTACGSPRILVGASLGGLAAVLALQDPEVQSALNALVMVDVVPAPTPHRVRQFLNTTAPHLLDSFLIENMLSKGPLLRKAASCIEIPILLIRGGPTSPMTDDEVLDFKALCPHLRVEHIDSAGHLIAQESPIALADILLRFDQSIAARNVDMYR